MNSEPIQHHDNATDDPNKRWHIDMRMAIDPSIESRKCKIHCPIHDMKEGCNQCTVYNEMMKDMAHCRYRVGPKVYQKLREIIKILEEDEVACKYKLNVITMLKKLEENK